MERIGVATGLASFLVLAAVSSDLSLAFTAGVATMVIVSAFAHHKTKKRKRRGESTKQ